MYRLLVKYLSLVYMCIYVYVYTCTVYYIQYTYRLLVKYLLLGMYVYIRVHEHVCV